MCSFLAIRFFLFYSDPWKNRQCGGEVLQIYEVNWTVKVRGPGLNVWRFVQSKTNPALGPNLLFHNFEPNANYCCIMYVKSNNNRYILCRIKKKMFGNWKCMWNFHWRVLGLVLIWHLSTRLFMRPFVFHTMRCPFGNPGQHRSRTFSLRYLM